MKNSIDTIGNRTRDLPACNAMPQPTAPPRAPVWPLEYLIEKPPVPTTRGTVISIKDTSCSELCMLLVCVHSYLKSVLKYKFLILSIHHPDTILTWTRIWGLKFMWPCIINVGEERTNGWQKWINIFTRTCVIRWFFLLQQYIRFPCFWHHSLKWQHVDITFCSLFLVK